MHIETRAVFRADICATDAIFYTQDTRRHYLTSSECQLSFGLCLTVTGKLLKRFFVYRDKHLLFSDTDDKYIAKCER